MFSVGSLFLSGTVDGRIFRTCLELQHRIAVDRCSWEMKSHQPVLKLVKEEQGHWDRLVRVKVLKPWLL